MLYNCTSVNRTVLGAKKIEFILDKVIKISHRENDSGNKVITTRILSHKLQGSSLIHEWASDMEELFNVLVLETDNNLNILKIVNLRDLFAKWHNGFKFKLLEKYRSLKAEEGAKILVRQTSNLLKTKKN